MRCCLGERLLFHRQISLQIDARGFNRLMAEPQRDHRRRGFCPSHGDVDKRVAVGPTGLDQQERDVVLLAEPMGEGAAGGPRTDDDVIVDLTRGFAMTPALFPSR